MTNQERNINTEINTAAAYLQLSVSPPQEIFPSIVGGGGGENYFRRNPAKHPQNPKKKRTKLIRIENPDGLNPSSSSCTTTSGVAVKKPKYGGKKPDPSAPKITRPCSECGKKFWSWKALFGHMRCHPERQWRGINPPPDFRRPENDGVMVGTEWTEEDHEVAACLLMLASSPSAFEKKGLSLVTISGINHGKLEIDDVVVRDVVATGCASGGGGGNGDCGFECSSCKKVFGSHQALGGHRATHKNVKGCFAIMRSDCEEVVIEDRNNVDAQNVDFSGSGELGEGMVSGGHKCGICSRVFATGQALGGHKRCHWEKGEGDHEPSSLSLVTQGGFNCNPFGGSRQSCGLDLNLPAPVENDLSSSSLSYSSSGLALDLRLGL
ncbi:hypothetical protein RHMOL_Rhmol05G0052500 [Rhododendron molle]|uniref:Uncharacterized protein n=1 Tax=Rhododendron molle TaxID=49168 RepID=A0ACC0NMV2_RHOML|nr:hypothetical protein RHMOL_Rhmol05G0052500 [Rhododendron molle]